MESGAAIVALAAVLLFFHVFATWYGDPTFRRLGYVAIVGHALAGVLVLYVIPYVWDISAFHETAQAILAGEPTRESTTVTAFAAFQAIVYAVFGAHPIVVSIVNGFFAVVLAVFVVELAHRLYPTLEGDRVLLSAALFTPLTFLFLSIPMRDALTAFGFLLALVLVGVAMTERAYWLLLPTIPLHGLLYLLRPELALLSLIGIVAACGARVFNRVSRRGISLPLVVGVGTVVGSVGFALFFERFPLSRLNDALAARAVGGAAYLEWMRYDDVLEVILVAPARALYFQFTPFPLHVTSVFDLLAALTVPFLLFLALAGAWSLRRYDVDPVLLTLLATVYVGGIVGYGLIDSNFGTAVRHRIPFEFLLMIFAAPVLANVERSLRGLANDPDGQPRGEDE